MSYLVAAGGGQRRASALPPPASALPPPAPCGTVQGMAFKGGGQNMEFWNLAVSGELTT